ncbi:MAG: RNA polymerase sigma factor [Gemmatimonadales bacterium]
MSAETIDEILPPLLPTAYRLAFRLCGNAADAEDIVQDAALNACRGFEGFTPGTNARAWFLRIVLNVFRSRYRRDRKVKMLSMEELADADDTAGWDRLSKADDDPTSRVIGEIDSQEVVRALDRLPDDYRSVAVLYFIEDLPYAEIAAIVGCPIGTVRSRLHRGRRILVRELQAYGGSPAVA